MNKIWLKEYPEGIAAEADVHAYSSLKDMVEQSFERFRDLPAYQNMGVALTYKDLERLSRDFGAFLQQGLGLQKGERVAIMMPNLLQYPVALFGALRAGLTVVNTNPLYTARELEHQLKDSGATAIVVLENFARTLQEVIANTQIKAVITTQVGDMFPAVRSILTNLVVKYMKRMVPPWDISGAVSFGHALQMGGGQKMADRGLGHDDVAFLQYTGGTTGVAKGAILSHGNMVANVQQTGAWIARDLEDGKETGVLPLPLYHVYALTMNLIMVRNGQQTILITNPRDLPAFIAELKRTRFSVIFGVNTLYNSLMNAPGFSDIAWSALKVTSAGGMAVQRAVAERWKQLTGVPIVEGYGLTETAPVAITNPLNIKDWTGALGLPIPSTDVIVLDEDGSELPVGQTGEICIRGPQVMKGYWNRPDETAKVFTKDGWLRSGDLGFMDERGYFKMTDRKKDVIVVSGFKVFPNEVEDVAMLHPGVLEVAAIGVPDEKSGEAVKLIVVKKDPSLTAEELLAHCKIHLTGYKVPKLVEFRTEPLPKSNVGKVLRRLLREAAQERQAA
jgi:long-chain acyl-CoA synthetase